MQRPRPRRYDVILAGGGAAALSLAYRLTEAFPDWSILIIDEKVKKENDHTWCYWTRTASYLDDISYRTWYRLRVSSESYDRTLDLTPYRYTMVRSSDFYRFIRGELAHRSNVDFMLGTVERVTDGAHAAEVSVNGLAYAGTWVFDSRYRASEYRPLTRRYHYLTQHFQGWEIETSEAVFDADLPHFFDFRTPQDGAMRFFYVLPYSEYRALVEYTIFSTDLLPAQDYRDALHHYVTSTLGVERYHVLFEEQDMIPMTNHPVQRRAGQRVLNIGTRGGQVKASSGYAFRRIQSDAVAIVHSLQRHHHPFHLPRPPRRYRIFDTLLLDILDHRGGLGKPIFLTLFETNPICRIFRFLDEEGTWRENVQLMASVPRWPFILASLRTGVRWLLR